MSTLSDSQPKTLYTIDELEPFFTEQDIQNRIEAMAQTINQTYRGCERLIIVCILKGAFLFMADLVRHIDIPCQVEFVRLASYGNDRVSSGTVKPVDLTLPDLSGQDVLVVEDIIDTGLTLHFFMDYLRSLHQTRSLRLAVLLDKVHARSTNIPPIEVHFKGFEVGDEFLVGYGLDYAGYYRNFPYIAQLPRV
ncbi:MAG: hypoxanthine phosphoribosyltransferase [Vampirovibrionales bacterium]